MIPRLLELVWLMSHRKIVTRRTPATAAVAVHTVDGMLFVGVRPATHNAA